MYSVSDENFIKSQDYPPKSARFPEKSQDLYDILLANIVLFLAPIADSKEILTYSNIKCFQSELILYNSMDMAESLKNLGFFGNKKPRSQNLTKNPQDLGGKPSVGNTGLVFYVSI